MFLGSSGATRGLAIDAAVEGHIKRRPLMGVEGSAVSALLGLDGFVVLAQLEGGGECG